MHPMHILFDLDGTLLDTAPDLHATLNHCLVSAGRDELSLESVKHMVGQGARALLEKGMSATGGMPEPDAFEKFVDLFFEHYEHHLSDHSIPYPGMVAALKQLKQSGCVMGVCTNKPAGFAKTILQDYDLNSYFSVMTGGDSFEVKKPDPAHIHKTLDLMPAAEGPIVMVGDTNNDIDAANAAGVISIAVSFGYGETPANELGADHVIDHFDELVPLLQEIAKTHEETKEASSPFHQTVFSD